MTKLKHFCTLNHNLLLHCMEKCILFGRLLQLNFFSASVAKLGTLKRPNIWFVSMNRTPCILTPHIPSVTLHQSLLEYCPDRSHQLSFAGSLTLSK